MDKESIALEEYRGMILARELLAIIVVQIKANKALNNEVNCNQKKILVCDKVRVCLL
jgi:hypothetical protein